MLLLYFLELRKSGTLSVLDATLLVMSGTVLRPADAVWLSALFVGTDAFKTGLTDVNEDEGIADVMGLMGVKP